MVKKRTVFKRVGLAVCFIILVGILFYHIFSNMDKNKLPEGIAKGNGRVEATEVDIATKLPGRLTEVLAKEGDSVEKDQIVARMDTTTLEAQLRQAEAELLRVKQARQTTLYKAEGLRLKLNLAQKELERSKNLLAKGSATQQQFDRDLTAKETLDVEYSASQSSIGEIDAGIAAAAAQTERCKADINDCLLKAPIRGLVLTRLAEPGEVLPPGGKVLTLVDPTDIYMNIYLSEFASGAVPLNADAKVILDAVPDKAFPAKVAYVSEKAQFTPKEVEAAEERQKLVFRVKISFQESDDKRLKPGMPGVSYIRFNPNVTWPALLK